MLFVSKTMIKIKHSLKENYPVTQQSKDFKKKNLTVGLRKHTAILKPKLVHGNWSRECHLVGREVWQCLARMALIFFFFLGSQEDGGSQRSLMARRVYVTGF